MPIRLAVLFLCLLLSLVAWPGGHGVAAGTLKPAQKQLYTKVFAAACLNALRSWCWGRYSAKIDHAAA